MKKRLTMACAGFVVSAAFAMPASASAVSPVLTHPTATAWCVGGGCLVKATNIGNVVFKVEDPPETITCTGAVLTGKLLRNPNNGEAIEGNITTASFTGTGSKGDCTGTGAFAGDFAVTTNVGNGVPWCLKAMPGAGMELQLRGGGCSEAARSITFVLDDTLLGIECKYERDTKTGPVKGEFNTDLGVEDAVGKIHAGASSTFVGEAGNSGFCPQKGELEMAFTLETDTATAEPLYIS
jgi:hypothetical protein